MPSRISDRDVPVAASELQRIASTTRGWSLTRMKVIWDIDEPALRPHQHHDRLLHDDTSMGGHLPFNSGPPRTLNLIFLISSVTLPIIPTPFAQILFALFHTPFPLPLHPQHQFRTLEVLSRAALELLTFLSHPPLVVIPHPPPPPPPPPPLVPPQKLIFFCPTQP